MARPRKNRRGKSDKKPKLENKIAAEPIETARKFPISSDAVDTIATWITIGLGAVAYLFDKIGHSTLALWTLFLTIWFALLALISHAHEKHWVLWLIRGRPWRWAFIAGIVIIALAVVTSKDDKAIATKINNRADIITPQVRRRLAASIKAAMPPKSIMFVSNNQTTEGKEFSDAFVEAVRASGCLLEKQVTIEGTGYMISGEQEGGVFVMQMDGETAASPQTVGLVNALASNGIPDVIAIPNNSKRPNKPGEATHTILVMKKARSTTE
jgi:hypothetical protein